MASNQSTSASEGEDYHHQGEGLSANHRHNVSSEVEVSRSSSHGGGGNDADASARRRRILLGVLFRLLVNGRESSGDDEMDQDDDDEDDSGDEYREPPAPNRPLRILSDAEAESLGATCRICFEGSSNNSSNDNNPLLSPCNCSGGSEWIHRQCLRQWQQHAVNNRVCNVCQARYSLSPPRPRNTFSAGNLLVYVDDYANGTFSKTIVLILKHDATSTFGLIINSPLQQDHQVSTLQVPDCFTQVSWRRGGPVCGGRLGLVRYIIAHTLPLTGQGDEPGDTNLDEEYVSRPALSSEPTLHFVYERDDPSSPATFPRADLPVLVRSLAARRQQGSTGNLFLFGGYSQWGRGQLAREIQRGSWGVCDDGSLEDVLRPLDATYYDELTSANSPNGRLLLGAQLFQED